MAELHRLSKWMPGYLQRNILTGLVPRDEAPGRQNGDCSRILQEMGSLETQIRPWLAQNRSYGLERKVTTILQAEQYMKFDYIFSDCSSMWWPETDRMRCRSCVDQYRLACEGDLRDKQDLTNRAQSGKRQVAVSGPKAATQPRPPTGLTGLFRRHKPRGY